MTPPCVPPHGGGRQRGATLVEFAFAWPLLLLAVLGAVEVTLWALESHAARTAALAGARSGTANGQAVALEVITPFLIGTSARAWCPGFAIPKPPGVWVCSRTAAGGGSEVLVGGSVPALVPLHNARSLPISADVVVPVEAFR